MTNWLEDLTEFSNQIWVFKWFFYLIKGALSAVTVTTCRKAVTIGLSFMFFTKPFSLQYLWSGVLVLVGIYLNLLSKNHDKFEANLVNYYQRYFKNKRPRNIQTDSYV